MKIVDGHLCESYQDVCHKLGLLNDGEEWHNVLIDAAERATIPAFRALYITIVLFCNPADCRWLFYSHWHEWYDDFMYDFEKKKQHVTIEQYKT